MALGALLVAGCGGGGGGSASTPAPGNEAIPRIEPYVRTSSMSLALRSAPEPSAVVRVAAQPVALGPLSAQESLRVAALRDLPVSAGKARPIGFSRALAETADVAAFQRRLVWQPLVGGGQAAALTVRSEGAAGLGLGLLVQRLPAAAVLRAYGTRGPDITATGQEVLALLALNAQAGDRSDNGRTWWLPPVDGDQVTLQIELPAGTDASQLAVALPSLSHLWTGPVTREATAGGNTLKIGEAATCEVDATCSPEYDAQARSVARLVFSDASFTYKCTGTLMADVGVTGIPWLLTANHCIDTQAKASTLTSYWFYQSTACNNATLVANYQNLYVRGGGAALLSGDAVNDTSFLRLLQSPPVGTVHAGSLVGPAATSTALASLHHPQGDLLKLSLGALDSYAACAGTNCTLVGDTSGDYLALRWSSGVTEAGSSGSAAFATVGSQRYVVGHLFAGTASCSDPGGLDYYGRFDRSYPALRTWLGNVPGT